MMENGFELDFPEEPDWASLDIFADPKPETDAEANEPDKS